MLQRQAFQEQSADEDRGELLSPTYILDLVKRRWLHFSIPFVLLLGAGTLLATMWPATYLSQGKILVESPQIPSDLVRPTVAVLANERVQIIEQRIMTRDNLLAIAKKFNLSMGWRSRLSGTELVDFIRERTQIQPLEFQFPKRDTQAIAFTVGFVYEQPDVATKVANELVTMLLNEDIRGRTNSATETTRFLSQDVKRLEAEISSIDTQAANLRRTRVAEGVPTGEAAQDDAKRLAALKAELLIKSATLSAEHPDIKALKRRIEAFDKSVANGTDNVAGDKPKADKAKPASQKTAAGAKGDRFVPNTPDQDADSSQQAPTSPSALAAEFDALITKRANLVTELNGVTQKLAAAKLGENLERGQFAERLQVIEQPTLPDKPISPNRQKIFGLALALSLMASAGFVFAAETLNPAIRRTSDLYSLIDSHLIVTIPYITTRGELRRKKRRLLYAGGAIAVVVLAGAAAVFFILPPLDILFIKISERLFG